MKIRFGINNIEENFKNSVIAMGVFDGVHKGHQKIINVLLKKATEFSATDLVITFDPFTKKILSGNKSSFIITSLKHKLKLIERYGVQNCLVIEKKEKIFDMSAIDFIKSVLVEKLKLKGIIIGENFKFGRDKTGDVRLLEEKGNIFDFKVFPVALLKEKKEIISSSSIREYVKEGKLNKASSALGRSFSVYGDLKRKKDLFQSVKKIPSYLLTHSQEIYPPGGFYEVVVAFVDKKVKIPGIVLVWEDNMKHKMNINQDTEAELRKNRIILFSDKITSNFLSGPVEVNFKKDLKKMNI